ncbi:SDR family oxidoreductase [Aeromicrobium wangtongii]|uniref:SDR family oxidoreductase n=1 Tax=Aeromicrobium wangtongii TaxID=2969247 RepID=UPI00201775C6|nr:SDR family oxidoreductase [Aeromicrobium wangtongii]MCL3818600.1 SDR family oxidoreductase [Aeromicrobium wangtongii]
MTMIVAGGSRGIGLELALALLPADRRVVIGFSADADAAHDAEKQLTSLGAAVRLVQTDLGTPQGAEALVDAAGDQPIDQVVHSCVTVGPPSLLQEDADWAQSWGHAMSVNAMSLVWLTRAALPRLHRGSTVLYVTSRGSSRVFPGYASVGPAKAFAESLVRHLAVELAPRGVRVNALAPAAQDTASFRAAFGPDSVGILQRAGAASPSGRAVQPEDYVGAARFLTTPAAAMVTGHVLPVYGGGDLV